MIGWLRNLRKHHVSRAEWYIALDLLQANEAREDALARTMGLDGVDVNARLDVIFTLREQRVEILRTLGWDREANELAADTAMRRSWPPIDTTPLIGPGGEA
jgi:hypothetical protein